MEWKPLIQVDLAFFNVPILVGHPVCQETRFSFRDLIIVFFGPSGSKLP